MLGKADALHICESMESREGKRDTLKQQTFCFPSALLLVKCPYVFVKMER